MMMYLPLIVGALLCFAILGSRYFAEASQPKSNRRRAIWTSRAKLAKILVGAAIALYTISTTLNHLGDKLVP